MTVKEFNTLPYGTVVCWREAPLSPRAGQLTERGRVEKAYSVKSIVWEDGQITDGNDDWVLQSVELEFKVPT